MATTSTQRFHSRCGKNIILSDNNTVARRIGSWDNGIVFTEQPVSLGTVFQVKILVYDATKWSGSISIGMTTLCPDDISQIPGHALKWNDHSDYWILDNNTVYHNGEMRELKVNLESLREGQTFDCIVSREGELHVYIDGVDKGIVWTGLPTHKPFWGVADVHGPTKKMQLVSSDQVSNPQATPPHQTSSGTEKDTNTVLHQQITHLQQDNIRLQQDNGHLQQDNTRLQQEVTTLQEENVHLQQENAIQTQIHQQEVTHHQQTISQLQQDNGRLQQDNALLTQDHQQELTRLREEARQLQFRLDQQPKLGSDTDISFWVVSHNEVRPTGQVLGEGGWGRVVVGSFRGQDVAMKQLHSIISSSDYYRDLLRREISLMAKVRHPNLLLFMAAVLDSPSNTPIIITELMDTNLRQAYHNAQLTNNGVKLSILRDVSAALNYLHLQSNPIIHRDVSSANVLLLALPNNKWRGKLSDFGSANLVQHAITPGPGAVMYTAPEAFERKQQTTKMDVFSFGKLLCEVLSNRLPDPDAFPSMLQSMAKDWPMHQLISSCVQQDPNKRPAMSYIVDQLNQR